ncbi:Tetratricopeptide-like helical domain containing protein [Quillaja saponaria]|uniref:Tetratricopeptide-like helical domain containing protein n=1 Tax=Quillaja saponaria TaxID=32244 RepID=A0AAD7PK59_QUISA|nr:Tetratricopeptide-like helical domain containing protein [Quillaja saponaria]
MSSIAPAAASSWIPRTSFPTKPSKFSNFQTYPLPPSSYSSRFRVVCHGGSSSNDLKLVLHDALDSSGINTNHAREARQGFCSQIQTFSDIERGTSITINRGVDLGKTALYIAAEDDSLVSHSSVPLPVDAFIERLDDLSMDYCPHYKSSFESSPENFLQSLERYLYVNKGFRRTNSDNQSEPRALYLHSVLTHRSGSAAMLSLIYSEILKMLRLWGLLDFDVEIFFPHDGLSLPRGYHKQKSKESDQAHIMTTQNLLVEILRNLKDAFWPFQHDHIKSLFLRAAHAANCMDKSNFDGESGFQLASAKAAQHRLDRGVWTSVRFGDMRRAISACERLILLEADPKETKRL